MRFKIDWANLIVGNLPFLFSFTLYLRASTSTSPLGGLFSEGRCNGGSYVLRVWGAYTAISRKVVRKKVRATIPKGNTGYDQYTVPDDCSCRTYFCCFPLALANICPWPPVPFFQISLKNRALKTTHNTFACTFSDNLSRNSCGRAYTRRGLFSEFYGISLALEFCVNK